jgi:hypothetical protein
MCPGAYGGEAGLSLVERTPFLGGETFLSNPIRVAFLHVCVVYDIRPSQALKAKCESQPSTITKFSHYLLNTTSPPPTGVRFLALRQI